MSDETADIRRQMVAEINHAPGRREDLEQKHGSVWDTAQLQEEFTLMEFMAPLVVVVRKVDNVKGSMYFQHDPRLYWGFEAAD